MSSFFSALTRASTFGMTSGDYEMVHSSLSTAGLTPTEVISLQVQEAGRLPEEISQDLVITEIERSVELEHKAKMMADLAAAREKSIASLTTISEKKALIAQKSMQSQQTIAAKHHYPTQVQAAYTNGLKKVLAGARMR